MQNKEKILKKQAYRKISSLNYFFKQKSLIYSFLRGNRLFRVTRGA